MCAARLTLSPTPILPPPDLLPSAPFLCAPRFWLRVRGAAARKPGLHGTYAASGAAAGGGADADAGDSGVTCVDVGVTGANPMMMRGPDSPQRG